MGKILRDFANGMVFVFRGIFFFLRNRVLWKYSLFPLGITALVYILGGWAFLTCAGVLVNKIHVWSENLPRWLSFLAYPGGFFVYCFTIAIFWLILVFCSDSLYEFAGSFFQDAWIRKIRFLQNGGMKEVVFSPQKVTFILKSVWEIFLYNLGSIGLFILLFTGGSLLLPFTWLLCALLIGYRFCVSLLAAVGACYGLTFTRSREVAARHKARIAGFGFIVYILYGIPFGVILFLPGVMCASVLLFTQLREEDKEFF